MPILMFISILLVLVFLDGEGRGGVHLVLVWSRDHNIDATQDCLNKAERLHLNNDVVIFCHFFEMVGICIQYNDISKYWLSAITATFISNINLKYHIGAYFYIPTFILSFLISQIKVPLQSLVRSY